MGLKSYLSTKRLRRKFKSTGDALACAENPAFTASPISKQDEDVKFQLIDYNHSPGENRLRDPEPQTEKVPEPCMCECWTFKSLPSHNSMSQSCTQIETAYCSLPPNMTTSLQCDCMMKSRVIHRRRRSRIRTNPRLPLPPASPDYRHERRCRRPEPRLSRFISEVEEIMREQLKINPPPSEELSSQSDSDGGTMSYPSTSRSDSPCQTNHPLASPSEGYKSADPTEESIKTDETSEISSSNQHKKLTRQITPRPKISELLTQSLYEPRKNTSFISASHSCLPQHGSMTTSLYSSRTELLNDKVKKLCQSTTQLNEKIRLAKLESSYIQVSVQ